MIRVRRNLRCFLLVTALALATTGLSPAADVKPDDPLGSAMDGIATVEITRQMTPPDWALMERHLLDRLYPAAEEFVQTYTRDDGTLIWRDAWPGMDGSDDGYESFYNFPLYYALGGPEEIHHLSRRLWDAVTRQFTAYGQVHNEFDAYYDWMHHGESYTYFYFFGLADPMVEKDRRRSFRFAGLYMGEDPQAPNYDAERKLIRSPITGSRGPRFVNSAEDWVTHRDVLAGYPLPYDDIPNVTDSAAWIDDDKFPFILEAMNQRMMRGDVPLNLTATSLVANAFMYGQDPKYKEWVEQYVDAWIERTRKNNGVLPDNVGLSGKIGENMGGRWWGGYYGWRWPHGLFNQVESTLIGATNAYLLSGDPKYLELPRSVLDLVRSKARVEDGQVLVPHRHGEQGWYDYRPIRPQHLVALWYVSQAAEDYRRIEELTQIAPWDTLHYSKSKGDWEHAGPWFAFIEGRNPQYPQKILRATYAETLARLDRIRNDRSKPDEQNVHHWQQRNPVVLEGLVQLTLGCPNHVYHGGLLHCRVFHYDPVRRRPGLPPDVAVLVDKIDPEGVSLQVVNLHPSQPRTLVIKAGAFGEHHFTEVQHGAEAIEVDRQWVQVRLRPGAGGRLDLGMRRFEHPPSYRFPWHEQ